MPFTTLLVIVFLSWVSGFIAALGLVRGEIIQMRNNDKDFGA